VSAASRNVRATPSVEVSRTVNGCHVRLSTRGGSNEDVWAGSGVRCRLSLTVTRERLAVFVWLRLNIGERRRR
jgi:hypothetical protein